MQILLLKKCYNNFVKFSFFMFLFFLPLSEAFKQISLGFLLIIFLYELFIKHLRVKIDIINFFILFHLLIAFFGLYFGVNYHNTLKQLPDLIEIVFVFFLFRYFDFKKYNLSLEKLFNLLFISFILTGLYGIYYYYILHKEIYLTLKSVGSVNRSTVYAMFIFILSFGFYMKNKSLISFITMIFAFIFILLTGSRMGIYSLPIAILILLFLFNKLNLKNLMVIFGLSFIILGILFIFFPNSFIVYKIKKGFNDIPRIQIWVSCIYIYLSHNLLFGIGMGNSILFTTKTYFGDKAVEGYINNPHNTYLDMLTERGFLGFISYLGFIIALLVKFFKNRNFFMSKISIATILISLVMSFMNITFRYEFAMLFMIIIGLSLNKSIINEKTNLSSS
jgi:O-antigen ligase